MATNRYKARNQDLNLISRVNSELCDGGAAGGLLASYKSSGTFFGLHALFFPQPSWSAHHLHTSKPLEYQDLSISLSSEPIKRWGLVGPVTGTQVTMEVEGEDIEHKIGSVIQKYDFKTVITLG